MAGPELTAARAANVAALPRMRATFPLQVMGELGLNNGDVWWMDQHVLLFWCPELLVLNVDIRSRVDLRDGGTIEIWLRTLPDETPARHANGYLHLASWRASEPRDARKATARLRETNPEVFGKDYRSPRLPERAAEAGVGPREPTAAEIMAAKHAEALAEIEAGVKKTRAKRWRNWTVAAAAGLTMGAATGSIVDDASTARLVAFRSDPATAIRYGLLRNGNFAGESLDGVDLSGADMRDSRLVGASFVAAKLVGAHLNLSDLRRADFSRANLSTASLSGARLDDSVFRGADVRGTEISGDAKGSDFLGALYSEETRWAGGKPAPGAVGPGANVEQVWFDRLDAQGVDLRRLHARGARLADSTLQGANLGGADLSHTTMERANLTGAILAGATVVEAVCDGCVFRDATLDGFVATNAEFPYADFSRSKGTRPEFVGANFKLANLSGVLWQQADFRKANLSAANLSGAGLSGCWLLGADLSLANITGAQLKDCVADEFTIWPAGASPWIYGALEVTAGGDARGANLPASADLSERQLKRLRGSRMTAVDASWSGSVLEGADFNNAALSGGVFDRCDLHGVNFSGADLTKARFTGATLKGANLSQAKICDADFSSADLGGAKFDRAIACGSTRWPGNKPPKGIILK